MRLPCHGPHLPSADKCLTDRLGKDRTMADDKKKTGSPDNKRINVNEPYELRDWSKKLGVSEQKLRETVQRVGTSAEAVKDRLGKRS